MQNALLLVLVGVVSGVLGAGVVYALMRAKIKSLKEDLESAKNYIENIKNKELSSNVKMDIPKEKEPNIQESKKQTQKELNENLGYSFKDKLDLDSFESSSRLEDLKSLSKAVEEVESLTVDGDLFDDIDSFKSSDLMVFERGFDETPNIKRENFKEFAKKRILVAEDNPVNSKLITILFSKSGIDVDVAEDGLEALSKIREALKSGKPYDLVLMDVHMPKMDGLEATLSIRADESLKNIPIIALTASTDEDEVKAILESGMNGYLSKPIKLGKLYTAFNVFFKSESQNIISKEAQKEQKSSKRLKILNIQEGIEHTNHDKSLYKAILNDFLKNYSNSAAKFKEYLEKRDLDSLKALIIDLEGLVGTIGADELYSILQNLNELVIKEDVDKIKKHFDDFEESLTKLLNATKLYLNK